MCAGFAATRPLIAVSLSRLASAISMAHNAQSTLPIQLVASTQNAEAPAVGCGGRFGRKLSGGILLACCLVTPMAGSTSMWGDRGATLPTSSHDGRPVRVGMLAWRTGIVGPVAAGSTCAWGTLQSEQDLLELAQGEGTRADEADDTHHDAGEHPRGHLGTEEHGDKPRAQKLAQALDEHEHAHAD